MHYFSFRSRAVLTGDMLKVLVFFSLVLVAACLPAQPQPEQKLKEVIGTKPEDLPKTMKDALKRMEAIDVDKVLSNDRILSNYLKCFLNRGPCTSEAKNVKKFIGLLVQTRCVECDPKHRKIIKKAMITVKTKKPKEYQELVHLYDPKGKEAGELEKFLLSAK